MSSTYMDGAGVVAGWIAFTAKTEDISPLQNSDFDHC